MRLLRLVQVYSSPLVDPNAGSSFAHFVHGTAIREWLSNPEAALRAGEAAAQRALEVDPKARKAAEDAAAAARATSAAAVTFQNFQPETRPAAGTPPPSGPDGSPGNEPEPRRLRRVRPPPQL